MKITEIISYFFLEDTNDPKSFSLGRLMVFGCGLTAFIASLATIHMGLNAIGNLVEIVQGTKQWIPAETAVLSLMIGFCTALWTAVFTGKYFTRKSENNITNNIQ